MDIVGEDDDKNSPRASPHARRRLPEKPKRNTHCPVRYGTYVTHMQDVHRNDNSLDDRCYTILNLMDSFPHCLSP